MANQPKFIYKILRYEFWPWYCMFIPLFPIYIYGVIRTFKLLYFTAANPTIDMGGFFGERKIEILDLIPTEFKVKSVHIKDPKIESIEHILTQDGIMLPVIAKPNIGERGFEVKLIETMDDLVNYFKTHTDFLIQEYVNYPLELGILYYRYPNNSIGHVSSITEKKFIAVKGDGKSNVRELIKKHPRHRLYIDLLERDFKTRLNVVPEKDVEFVVHRIGNHVKGTQFLDGNVHLSNTLDQTFTRINENIEGVYYGRYDLKVPSYESLLKGENIKIFELNGVSSEPGHIYDQTHVLKAYKELAKHWLVIIKVSRQNIKKGVKTTPFLLFFKQVKNHFIR